MHHTLLFFITLAAGMGQRIDIVPTLSGVESGFAILTEPRTHMLNTIVGSGGITIQNLSDHTVSVSVYTINKERPATIRVTPDVLSTGRNIDLD